MQLQPCCASATGTCPLSQSHQSVVHNLWAMLSLVCGLKGCNAHPPPFQARPCSTSDHPTNKTAGKAVSGTQSLALEETCIRQSMAHPSFAPGGVRPVSVLLEEPSAVSNQFQKLCLLHDLLHLVLRPSVRIGRQRGAGRRGQRRQSLHRTACA